MKRRAALLVGLANGDARAALNALEFAGRRDRGREGARAIDAAVVREAMQRRASRYDKGGDMHYDIDQRVHQIDARERPGRGASTGSRA